MKKRRMLSVIAVMLICVCALSGCKKNVGTPEDNAVKDEESDDNIEGDDEDAFVFGFSVIDMQNPYFITLEGATREAVESNGYRMITKDPASDAATQEAQIQEMIDEGIDAVFLCPVDWEEITDSLKALKDAGVRIINVDSQVKEMEYVDAYIGSDNHNAGFICGEDLIAKRPDGGKIAILECPTQNSINDRITGFEEAIAEAEKGFDVVAREDTGGEFDKALEASKRILEENPDITAIMCGNDQIAVGAMTAVNLAKMEDVIIYGVDGSPDIKKEFKKAGCQIAGTAAQSPINMGKTAAKTGISILKGEEFEPEVYEEVFMINKDNVDMYGIDGWQ